ncbi:2Fe-2S iron-sulfur cluster-binding protein [Marinobacter caseinilyticus]|uniref:2Fe-2S iron-sulfur cluster-binding protein n=1 Tax=Marinobacter caseinilyticus TaxID=2692195 RepID=UPI001A94CC98|nr:2Fe-2S iron-sulfur cluster-binding protein [Marinobacter caseinilyticus]
MNERDPVPEPGKAAGALHRVYLQPSKLSFLASEADDLLAAATQAGIAVPFACRNGVCELCEARLIDGTALNTRNQQTLSPATRLMLCRTQARSSLELEIEAVMAAGQTTPREFQANVVGVHSISHDVYRVELQLPRRRELEFHAGQYLSVVLPDAEPCYFSIASSPLDQHLELHIQASPDWVSAQRVVDALKSGQAVTLQLPHGHACLAAAPEKPLVMVAAGTGFAQMKSMVDYLRTTNSEQPVSLFWGVRRLEDMYLRSLAQQWHETWPPFTFIPVVGDDEDNDWSGHHDQLVGSVLATRSDWSDVQVMASGSPTMVYTLMDALVEAGLPAGAFLSDVLEYAPR